MRLLLVPAALLAMFSLAQSVARAEELPRLIDFYGSPTVRHLAGNGGLTAGFTDRGRLALFRWPSPSFNDHLAYKTVTDSDGIAHEDDNHGVFWALQVGDDVLWATDPRWQVSFANPINAVVPMPEYEFALDGAGIRVSQSSFVPPERDVLVIEFNIEGVDSSAEETPALYLYANFTPCTRKLPELPVADWAFDHMNDFAAFVDQKRRSIFHFRPDQPGRLARQRAEAMSATPLDPAAWEAFGPGAWIAYSALPGLLEMSCGEEGLGPASMLTSLQEGGAGAAVGDAVSVSRLEFQKTSSGYTATVFIAVADQYRDAQEILAAAQLAGADALRADAFAFWNQRMMQTGVSPDMDTQTLLLTLRCLNTLAVCTDRASAAIVRSPLTQPALARDWTRHGVWMGYAYDLAGFEEVAEKHLSFYLDAVRLVPLDAVPAGSIPAALYGDGAPAAPHLVIDAEAVGWLLWGVWQHARLLDAPRREAYLESVWERLAAAIGFLVAWAEPNTGQPLPAFDPDMGYDRQSRQLLATTHMGLESGFAIAETIGRQLPPDWIRRKQQIDVLVRQLLLNPDLSWDVGELLPFHWGDILQAGDPRLAASIEQRLDRLPELWGERAAAALLDVAMVYRDDPARLASLRAHIGPMLRRTFLLGDGGRTDAAAPQTLAFPDALAAAKAYIATMLVLEAEELVSETGATLPQVQ